MDGRPILVPAGIGIDTENPDVRRFDEPDGSVSYGGINVCAVACISPLHTHYPTGILHTESATPEPNTLGQFFTEWGVRTQRHLRGRVLRPGADRDLRQRRALFDGDPRAIELTDQKEIAIVIGTPPADDPVDGGFLAGVGESPRRARSRAFAAGARARLGSGDLSPG